MKRLLQSFFYGFLSLIVLFSPFCPIPSTNAATTDQTTAAYYVSKYGFDLPQTQNVIDPTVQQLLAKMWPYALSAIQKYNSRYGKSVEPQLVMWWSYSEGIEGRTNYSNCANESPASGSYFKTIENCNRPDFWQLGYGIQFGNIWLLKNAFADTHGDPNNASLVQQVGQAVLDSDKTQGTTPPCGGYSCTFPSNTIDEIMGDVHCGQTQCPGTQETTSNWWASVLSRDPAINVYINAQGLSGFSHAQTKGWVGCYYAEPCWQSESNKLGQILDFLKTQPANGADTSGANACVGHGACSNCLNTNVGTNTDNNCSTLGGGNGSGSGTGGSGSSNMIAAYADALAKAIVAHCPSSNGFPTAGYALVTSSTEGCINNIAPDSILSSYTLPAVIARLHLSTDEAGNSGHLQCAGFVQAVSIGVKKQLPNGSAGQYAHDGIPGYTWHAHGTDMQLGDIPVWDTHIAVVISIPDSSHFKVAEANGGSGTVGEETYPYTNNPYGTGLTYYGYLRAQ